MKHKNKCEVKNCRNNWDLEYLGKRICQKHFEMNDIVRDEDVVK